MSRITVLMSVYNGMPYLPPAVDSIRQQSVGDWEMVIVDDGSGDGSAAYLASLTDPRIRVIRQENAGLAAALNRGLQDCRTEWIARFDADDVAEPDRLQRQLEFVDARPQLGMVGSQFRYFGECRVGRTSQLPLDHATIVDHLRCGRHAICHSTIVCRTELLTSIGGYWPEGIAEDWDMYLRMSEVTQIANVDLPLLRVRVHGSSINGSRVRELRERIAYACDRSSRRRAGLPPVDYATFAAGRQDRAIWQRFADRLDAVAMAQYRHGLAQLLGNQRWVGLSRIGLSGVCSPRLTWQRLTRIVERLSRRQTAYHSHQPQVI